MRPEEEELRVQWHAHGMTARVRPGYDATLLVRGLRGLGLMICVALGILQSWAFFVLALPFLVWMSPSREPDTVAVTLGAGSLKVGEDPPVSLEAFSTVVTVGGRLVVLGRGRVSVPMAGNSRQARTWMEAQLRKSLMQPIRESPDERRARVEAEGLLQHLAEAKERGAS